MKKAGIALVVLVLLLPVIQRYWPKPVTPERFQAALQSAGFSVTDVRQDSRPMLGADLQVSMKVNDDAVELYHFTDEGRIATQLEYQKPDAGSVMVEAWNLSESLGAAKPKNKPISAVRNGMFMMTVTSEDVSLRQRVVQVFRSL